MHPPGGLTAVVIMMVTAQIRQGLEFARPVSSLAFWGVSSNWKLFLFFCKKGLTDPRLLVILPVPTGTDARPTADGSGRGSGGRVLR